MIAAASEWTVATVLAAAESTARARDLEVRAFMVGGGRRPGPAVRIEVLRQPDPGGVPNLPGYNHLTSQTTPLDLDTRVVTCWLELPAAELDAAAAEPDGVAELVAREVTKVLRMRHGQGAAA